MEIRSSLDAVVMLEGRSDTSSDTEHSADDDPLFVVLGDQWSERNSLGCLDPVPNDILLCVADLLPGKDLRSLTLVCRTLNELCVPMLKAGEGIVKAERVFREFLDAASFPADLIEDLRHERSDPDRLAIEYQAWTSRTDALQKRTSPDDVKRVDRAMQAVAKGSRATAGWTEEPLQRCEASLQRWILTHVSWSRFPASRHRTR